MQYTLACVIAQWYQVYNEPVVHALWRAIVSRNGVISSKPLTLVTASGSVLRSVQINVHTTAEQIVEATESVHLPSDLKKWLVGPLWPLVEAGDELVVRVASFDCCRMALAAVPNRTIHAAHWNPTGTQIATAHSDHCIRIWDACTFTCLYTLRGHTNYVLYVRWNHDGTRLASVGGDKRFCIWDTAIWKAIHVSPTYSQSLTVVAWDPRGRWLAVGAYNGLYLYHTTSHYPRFQCLDWRCHRKIEWNASGSHLAVYEEMGFIHMYKTDTWQDQVVCRANSFSWHPNGHWITILVAGQLMFMDLNLQIVRIIHVDYNLSGLQWDYSGTRLSIIHRTYKLSILRITDETCSSVGTIGGTYDSHPSHSLNWHPCAPRLLTYQSGVLRLWR